MSPEIRFGIKPFCEKELRHCTNAWIPKAAPLVALRRERNLLCGARSTGGSDVLWTSQLVEKVFFDKLLDCEKHTQTRKKPPSAYIGTVGGF